VLADPKIICSPVHQNGQLDSSNRPVSLPSERKPDLGVQPSRDFRESTRKSY